MAKALTKFYDVIYSTKSGRTMIARKIEGKTQAEAKKNLKLQMRKSTSFNKIISVIQN